MKALSYISLADGFVNESKEILGDNLVGVYLHGSAAMGCFNPDKSDLDLIVVVKNEISDEVKRRYMDAVVSLSDAAPAKGIEMSVVKEEVCRTFVYPTPFLLHFSIAHFDWYRRDPDGFILNMKGKDRDLAAHFTVIINRGAALYGEEIKNLFAPVPEEDYFDSIFRDIENAAEDILSDPMYVVLNLCRVLAYKSERKILSKKEGGEWGLSRVDREFSPLICAALTEYAAALPTAYDKALSERFALYCLDRIKE